MLNSFLYSLYCFWSGRFDGYIYIQDAKIADSIKDYNRDVRDFDREIVLVPDDWNAYYNRGLAEAHLGKYDSAKLDYWRIIKSGIKSSLGYEGLGYLYKDMRQYKKSIAEFDTAILVDSNNTILYYIRGIDKDRIGLDKDAIADFSQVIKIDPCYADAYYSRGIIKSKLGKNEEAIKDYAKALVLKPDSVIIFYYRGEAEGKLGKYDEAILDLNKAAKYFPQSYKVYCTKGIVESMINKQNESLADLSKSVRLNPNEADTYFNRALTYAKLNRYTNALQDFHTARNLYLQDNDTAMANHTQEDIIKLKKVMNIK